MSKKPQYAKVEQPFGIDPPIVHCPICGQASLTLDEDGTGNYTPCEHMVFLYIGSINEFGYTSKEFQDNLDELDENKHPYGFEFNNFQKILEDIGYNNKLLALEVTYGGMAGGPVWHTDVFGFDYGKIKNDE